MADFTKSAPPAPGNLTGHVTSTGLAAVLGAFTKAELTAAVSDGTPSYVGDTPLTEQADAVWEAGTGTTPSIVAPDAIAAAIAALGGGAAGGWVLIAETQPVTDVATVDFTGLSGYSHIMVFYACELTGNTANLAISARVSAGTWRTITTGATAGATPDARSGVLNISNFGLAATHKVAHFTETVSSSGMDASNAVSISTPDIHSLGYISYQEAWDELRFDSTVGNIEGSSADKRGRFSIYGMAT
jgi:hypothetical protein